MGMVSKKGIARLAEKIINFQSRGTRTTVKKKKRRSRPEDGRSQKVGGGMYAAVQRMACDTGGTPGAKICE